MVPVGEYIERYNELTGNTLPCGPIYQSNGLRVHVARHHAGEPDHLADVPQILSDPDYIGVHPKIDNSVEFVKTLGKNVMVCVKLEETDGYLYVASVFEISQGKLNNRINSGRLRKC